MFHTKLKAIAKLPVGLGVINGPSKRGNMKAKKRGMINLSSPAIKHRGHQQTAGLAPFFRASTQSCRFLCAGPGDEILIDFEPVFVLTCVTALQARRARFTTNIQKGALLSRLLSPRRRSPPAPGLLGVGGCTVYCF